MTTPSFVAILDLSIAATDRHAAIAQLESEQPVVSAMPGCVGFRVFASRQSDGGITVLHEWTDAPSFEDYLVSDAFARSSELLRPMMTSAPVSRRFNVELVETVH
jgi:quinol monooxygenase YgiN